jgi:hypothetical protein
MQNYRNQSKDKKEMDQATRDMKHRETTNPCDNKHDKQDDPDTHFLASKNPKLRLCLSGPISIRPTA